jgi:hypothetical protein
MNLELVKNIAYVSETTREKEISLEEIKFNFIKNIIKKDIEVSLWKNMACNVFGEFDIYSEFSAELNSFEYVTSFLLGINVNFAEDSFGYLVSGISTENYFKLMIKDSKQSDKYDTEKLSIKFTNFILESLKFYYFPMSEAKEKLFRLEKEFFGNGGNDPTMYEYINPKYLN